MPRARRKPKRSSTSWIIGVAVVAVAAVAVAIFATRQGTPGSKTSNALGACGSATCGQANAPVTIEVFSDFQ